MTVSSSGRYNRLDSKSGNSCGRTFFKLAFNVKFIVLTCLLVTIISFVVFIRGKYPWPKHGQLEKLALERHAGIRSKFIDFSDDRITKMPETLRTLAPDIVLSINQCPHPRNPWPDLSKSLRSLDNDPACKKALFSAACQLEKGLLYDSSLPVTCPEDAKSEGKFVGSAKILFVIDVNSGAARQAERLLINLYQKRHFYLLLVANCYGPAAERLTRLQNASSNVRLLFYDVECPDNSAMDVSVPQTPETWRTIVENSTTWSWNYLLSLDAYDFPLLNVDKLTLFLDNHFGTNFIESYSIEETSVYLTNISIAPCEDHRRWPIGQGRPPANLRYFQGPPWYLLTRDFLSYALFSDDDKLASGLRKFASLTPFPAPLLFHTLAHNGRFCHSFVNESLRLTKFHIYEQRSRDNGGRVTPQEQEQLGSWTFSPKDFVYLSELRKPLQISVVDGQKFFARRFDPTVNQQIIKDVESTLDEPSRLSFDAPRLHSYWQTLWTRRMTDKRKSTLRYAAVSRLLADLCLKRLKRCPNLDVQTPNVAISELSLFRDFDMNDGLILSMNVSCSGDDHSSQPADTPLECFVNFLHHERIKEAISDITDLRNELLHVRMGSDYDFMDDTFRNYAGSVIVDTNENFGLRTQWIPGEMGSHYEFAWLDPKEFVAGTTMGNVGPWSTTHFQPKSDDLQYMSTGVWTAAMLFDGKVIAATEFLVLPETKQAYERCDVKERLRWAKKFYEVNRVCVPSSFSKFSKTCSCGPPVIPSCEKTEWSTRSPDPKSDFVKIIGKRN